MSTSNDGGPAFPHLHNTCQRVNESEHHEGLSIRDYFAAKAMELVFPSCAERDFNVVARRVAAGAYIMADAMLAARQTKANMAIADVLQTLKLSRGFLDRELKDILRDNTVGGTGRREDVEDSDSLEYIQIWEDMISEIDDALAKAGVKP